MFLSGKKGREDIYDRSCLYTWVFPLVGISDLCSDVFLSTIPESHMGCVHMLSNGQICSRLTVYNI